MRKRPRFRTVDYSLAEIGEMCKTVPAGSTPTLAEVGMSVDNPWGMGSGEIIDVSAIGCLVRWENLKCTGSATDLLPWEAVALNHVRPAPTPKAKADVDTADLSFLPPDAREPFRLLVKFAAFCDRIQLHASDTDSEHAKDAIKNIKNGDGYGDVLGMFADALFLWNFPAADKGEQEGQVPDAA